MDTEMVAGDMSDLMGEERTNWEKMMNDPKKRGVCAPADIVDFFEDEPKANLLEYNRFLFEETDMRKGFLKDMPAEPKDFDQWLEWVGQDDKGREMISGWKEIWIMAECREGGRRGGKMDEKMEYLKDFM